MRFSTFLLILSFFTAGSLRADPCLQNSDKNNSGLDHFSFFPQCQRPAVGSASKKLGHLMPGKYVVSRKPNQAGREVYEVAVRFNFQPADDQGQVRSQKKKEVEALTRRCFGFASEFLRGPSGEKMILKLSAPSDSVRTNPVPILVSKKCGDESHGNTGGRSNSLCFKPDVFEYCPILLHETFHHLGLVDEYPSHWRGDSDCRVQGPDNSLMADFGSTVRLIIPTFKITRLTCEDAFQQKNCVLQKIRTFQPAPDGMNELFVNGLDSIVSANSISGKALAHDLGVPKTRGIPDFSYLTFRDSVKDRPISAHEYQQVEIIPGEGESLIQPAHFSAIIFPECLINSLFYSCGQNALHTNAKPDHCLPKPKECQVKDRWTRFPEGIVP